MKVAYWYNNKDIRLKDELKPTPEPDEMLVKVFSCGICGSDIVEWYRLPRAPLVPGHEIGAEVAETGSSITSFTPGDRVFLAPKVPCMQCDYCKKGQYPICSTVKDRLPGGFAEYVLVPRKLIDNGAYLLPENITYDQSTFIEPLACVIRAQNLAGLKKDQTVMVIGSGMSGLLHIKLAKSKNCKVIATDISETRLKTARESGADITLLASDNISEFFNGQNKKPDVVILCTEAIPAVEQAWQCVNSGGAIVFFAVPGPDKMVTIPINDFWMREIRILTSYYCGPPDIVEAISKIESEQVKVDELITHRLPLEKILEGFRLVTEGSVSLKVIINPHSS